MAIILLRKYERDNRLTSFVELAYFIILKYSLSFSDFAPLYDFSVNIGFYPIARAIEEFEQIQIDNIETAIIHALIDDGYRRESIIETYEQKHTRNQILRSTNKDICYIAPTSFGKSSIVLEHIAAHWEVFKKIAVIVPTKSLLMQSYRAVRSKGFDAKVIIHDEMYNNEERFIAVLTQERALRLLDKHNTYFVLGAADDLDLSEDGVFCNTFENYPVDRMKVRVMSSDKYPQFMIMEISVKNAAVAIFEEGLEKLLYRLNFKIPGYKEGSAAFWSNVYDEAAVCDSAEKE